MAKAKSKFFSFSFGCRVNEAEKEEIDRKMTQNGFSFNKDHPDVFIINTCSVTHKAEREARQMVYQVKKGLPEAKIVVTGCSATYWLKHDLYKKLPVDMVIDNVNKEYLVDLIQKRFNLTSKHPQKLPPKKTNKFIGSGRVMVKIQDGCQRYCTFCIVPYLRGMPKSETINNLELKIKGFEGTAKEVVLTAINTQAFGYDTKESFVDLLKDIIDKTSIPRISLGSIHPWSLTDDFYNFYINYLPKNRLVNFFHVPLQSGSNKMLILMKRGYRREEMLDNLKKIEKINPFALLATDVIVGFLEETEADFKETYQFLDQSPISKFHVFRFSKRAKTQADYMSKRLKEPSAEEKQKWAESLIKLSEKKYQEFMKKNVDRISTVLFLEKTVNGYREGLLDNQLPIWVAAKGLRTTSEVIQAGNIRSVKVMEFKKGRLFGKIV